MNDSEKLVAGCFGLVIAAEATALVLADQRLALVFAGVAVALAVAVLLSRLGESRSGAAELADHDALSSLQQWKSRTESLLRWADSTRSDWDRHLRPKLAREFMMSTRHRDPATLDATGRILFGDELWTWVDPHNVAQDGRREPGPGRATLDEIVRRLEQI